MYGSEMMDPYTTNMHMYGRVPRGQGVDSNMNQFYGRKSLGGVGTETATLGLLGALVVGMYVVDGLLIGYMVGTNDSKRAIARRSAIVGTLVGIPTYALFMAASN